jgi:site-specific DNA-methyltransferase (adenine-specific)
VEAFVSVRLEHGDMLAVLPTLSQRFHAVVTDPPYHLVSIVRRFSKSNPLDVEKNATARKIAGQGASPHGRAARGFMGKQWDGGDIAFQPETWALVGSVMLPGAHLVAFGGTKGFHRMACAIEDAGFEIRDTLAVAVRLRLPQEPQPEGRVGGLGHGAETGLRADCAGALADGGEDRRGEPCRASVRGDQRRCLPD